MKKISSFVRFKSNVSTRSTLMLLCNWRGYNISICPWKFHLSTHATREALLNDLFRIPCGSYHLAYRRIKWLNFLNRGLIYRRNSMNAQLTRVNLLDSSKLLGYDCYAVKIIGQFSYLIPHTARRVNLCFVERRKKVVQKAGKKKRKEERFDASSAFPFRSSSTRFLTDACSAIHHAGFFFFSPRSRKEQR